MIIDAHTHIFPYLGEASGFDSVATHRMYMQKFVADSPASGIRRASDGVVVEDRSLWSLWDEHDPTPAGALDVNFRVGRFGRFEWTKNGVDYYMHLYGPSFQTLESSPEFLLAQMDYAGIDMAVLQNAWIYGQTNDYFAEAARKYPGRFVGTVQVNESRAYEEQELRELLRGVRDLGHRALYFASARFFEQGFRIALDDEIFTPFWNQVRELGVAVYFDLSALKEPGQDALSPYERFLHQMARLANWQRRYPEIPCVLVHGVPLRYIRKGDEFLPIPEELWQLWQQPSIHLEILFPMQVSHPAPGGTVWEYPYLQVHPIIKELYAKMGPTKLIWGSDLPNVERNCTYRQSRQYLTNHCPFISEADKGLLFGGNIARLLRVGG